MIASKFMNVQKVPMNMEPAHEVDEGRAEKAGFGSRFEQLELAVSFDKDFNSL